ncbi:hypothetical protein PGT21_013185 [Puccinia graminis f. sp. tritici]|uniref:Uncharacterized protein n=1 Tax=Puccinia graminis f. sp. tritici TaxID=56615 RepID=A0A5B0MF21_PUCGR|nr:hypothetical protein PGT21_013185 [Puccinia graminis f. sp. tritici]
MKIENIAAVEVFGWWWWLPVDRRLLSGKAVQAAGSVVIFSVTKVIDKPRSTRSHPSQANAPRVLHNTYPLLHVLQLLKEIEIFAHQTLRLPRVLQEGLSSAPGRRFACPGDHGREVSDEAYGRFLDSNHQPPP